MDNCISNIELNGILQETNLDIILNEYHYFNNNIALNEEKQKYNPFKDLFWKVIATIKTTIEWLIDTVKKFFKGIIDFIKNLFKKRKFENGKIVSENTEIIQEGLAKNLISSKLKEAVNILKKKPEKDLGLFPYTNLIKDYYSTQWTFFNRTQIDCKTLIMNLKRVKKSNFSQDYITNYINNINNKKNELEDQAFHIMVNTYKNIKGDSLAERIINFYTIETKENRGYYQWRISTHNIPIEQLLDCACNGKNWIASIEKMHSDVIGVLEDSKQEMINITKEFESATETQIINPLLSYISKVVKVSLEITKASNQIELYWMKECTQLINNIILEAKNL